jgi:hypothetical protein
MVKPKHGKTFLLFKEMAKPERSRERSLEDMEKIYHQHLHKSIWKTPHSLRRLEMPK